jgi:hypothetical protein
MAMPEPEFTSNDEPVTRGELNALHDEIHQILAIVRKWEPLAEKFLSNPAMKWARRNGGTRVQ